MEAHAPCFERLQVIRDDVPRSGAFNMALDEVLLGSTGGVALLRLYTWVEPTLTFGYFETSLSVEGVARGRPMVRRWTGGGIVEHGEDLTYSLCVPRCCVFASLRAAESYRRIHAAVASALHRCGLPAEPHGDLAAAQPNRSQANACFERPVLHDLLSDGRKVAGGAQRRSRTGLLHQGSVQVHFADAARRANWQDCMWRELPPALSGFCEERHPTPEEISRAKALASAKYASAAWTDRF